MIMHHYQVAQDAVVDLIGRLGRRVVGVAETELLCHALWTRDNALWSFHSHSAGHVLKHGGDRCTMVALYAVIEGWPFHALRRRASAHQLMMLWLDNMV